MHSHSGKPFHHRLPGMWLNSFKLGSRRVLGGSSLLRAMGGAAEPSPAQSTVSRLLRISAIAAAGAGVATIALPIALNTPPGLQAALALLNSMVPGKINVESMELSLRGWHASVNLQGVEVHEPEHLGAQLLLCAKQIQCDGSPFQLIQGNPTAVTITGATINGAYSAAARDFRLIRYLEVAGVLEAPPPRTATPPPSTPADAQDAATGVASQQHGEKQPAVSSAAPSSSRENTRESDVGSDTRAEAVSEEQQSGVSESKAETREAAQAGSFSRVLCSIDSSVGLSGHLKQPGLELILHDSQLLVSNDMRLILGGDLHVLGGFGPDNIRWLQSQAARTTTTTSTAITTSSPSPTAGSAVGDVEAAPEPAQTTELLQPPEITAGQAVVQDWWETAPSHAEAAAKLHQVLRVRGQDVAEPGEWRVLAPNLDMSMRVWKVEAPRSGADKPEISYTLLHQPAAMKLKFTEALGRFGLATVNPLLSTVTNVTEQQQGALGAQFMPDGGVLPYTSASMMVEPMCLQLGANRLITQLASGINLPGVSVTELTQEFLEAASSDGSKHKKNKKQQRGGGQPKAGSTAAGDAEQQGQEEDEDEDESVEVEAGQLLEAWVSGMHVRFERSGVIQQKRVDMLIGPAGLQAAVQAGGRKAKRALNKAMHLVVWGTADPDTDTIDFVVGLPDDVLGRIGVKHLPANYCLPIRMTGNMDTPELEVQGMAQRIKHLFWYQVAQVKKSKHKQQDGSDSGDEQVSEPAHSGNKVMQVVKVGKWLLSAVAGLVAPKGQKLAEIEEQIAQDAAAVPLQECEMPWQHGQVRAA